MLSLFGISMASIQPHDITGKMVDLETGEVILIFPEIKNQKDLNLGALNILGPTTEPGTNPVEQILTRSCWAKVSAAVFDTKFDYGNLS